jgi:hypothetical protein
MLGYIYRLVSDFEDEHGIHPNFLYLNTLHSEHLKTAFSDDYSMPSIMKLLQMELVIENDIMHPHVAWRYVAQRKIAC